MLVTLGSLRADAVGALTPPGHAAAGRDLTPHLDALIRQADWAGPAVAPSSYGMPSFASLVTGLGPWQHGAITVDRPRLAGDLPALAPVLAEHGYRSTLYLSSSWMRPGRGWARGFADVVPLRAGRRAAGHLASLGAPQERRRQFLWIQLPEPEAPYQRRDWLLPRLGNLPAGLAESLPERLEPWELERWADPSAPLPPHRLQELTALYRLNVAQADDRLGELLAALRGSGVWDETLLVVTSPNGEQLGDYGGTGSGGSLGRALIEVPLVIKLPASLRAGHKLAVAPGERPALARVWATLVEAVGGSAPPATAPSLFRAAPGGALSELYLGNGVNELSLVDGDRQLVWRARFSPPEPEYWRARLARYRDAAGPEPGERPGEIFGRLARAFATTPPLTGSGGPPELRLLRWTADGGSEPVDDPAATAAMAARLQRRWLAWQPCERSPAAMQQARQRGEIAVPEGAEGATGEPGG